MEQYQVFKKTGSLIKRNMGQMLIEIVVAIGIIGLVLIGVSDLMTRSARVTEFQKQRDEALSIIQKMLVDYRTERDSNPEDFYNTAGNTVVDPCITDSPYKCLVVMDKTTDAVTITVTAEWIDGGRTYSVSLSQFLSREVK